MTSSTGAPSTAPKAAPEPPTSDPLAAEYQRLVELNQAKDRFLQTVSHELRTPLTSILSCTELLADDRTGALSGDQRELVDIVGRSAGRLLRLVNDLLELAGLEAGRLPLRRELVDLTDVVAAAARSREPALVAAGLELRLDVEAGPPVHADAARLAQLLDNLLSNAEKYTPAGGRVVLAAHPAGGGWEVSVTDTGIERVDDGHGRIVAILGEAGVGKSRLVAELAAEASQRDWRVLVGRAYEAEGGLPLGPWVDALRSSGVAREAADPGAGAGVAGRSEPPPAGPGRHRALRRARFG